MGFLDIFRRQRPGNTDQAAYQKADGIAVGAKNNDDVTLTFNNKNITFTGDLADFDYDRILRQKQQNIYKLFE